MKAVIILMALVVAALAHNQNNNNEDRIIQRYGAGDIEGDGYNFNYETSDGTKRQEESQFQNVGTRYESPIGSFSYVGADGLTHTVNYVADENGFRPEGAHLPK